MAVPTRIFLTGFMGSGKTTIGPILANVLGYTFIDLDAAIEAKTQKSIPEIFESSGEAAFRVLEADVLREVGAAEKVVISLGGGAVTIQPTLEWILAHGVMVYLKTSPKTLARRLINKQDNRPLLKDENGDQLAFQALHEKIAMLLSKREVYYQKAQIVIDTQSLSIGQLVDRVAVSLSRYKEKRQRKN